MDSSFLKALPSSDFDAESKEALLRLYNEALSERDPGHLDVSVAEFESMLGEPGGSWIIAFEDDGTPVGMAALCMDGSRGAPLFLQMLAVEPKSQGRGAGTAILAACKRLAAELGVQRLVGCVLDDDKKAQSFYRKAKARIEYGPGGRVVDEQGRLTRVFSWDVPRPQVRPPGPMR